MENTADDENGPARAITILGYSCVAGVIWSVPNEGASFIPGKCPWRNTIASLFDHEAVTYPRRQLGMPLS